MKLNIVTAPSTKRMMCSIGAFHYVSITGAQTNTFVIGYEDAHSAGTEGIHESNSSEGVIFEQAIETQENHELFSVDKNALFYLISSNAYFVKVLDWRDLGVTQIQ